MRLSRPPAAAAASRSSAIAVPVPAAARFPSAIACLPRRCRALLPTRRKVSPAVVASVRAAAAAADADPPSPAAASSSSTAGLVFGPGAEGSWDSHGIGAPVVRVNLRRFSKPRFLFILSLSIPLLFLQPQPRHSFSISQKKKKSFQKKGPVLCRR